MNIIFKTPNLGGAYQPIQQRNITDVPDGYAVFDIDTTQFYEYNGFVTLTIETVDGIDTVTAYEPNVEAWEAWKASLPEPVPPEPTMEERVTELEAQLAESDETAIYLFEAQAAQEEINASQDEALMALFEMIGGEE